MFKRRLAAGWKIKSVDDDDTTSADWHRRIPAVVSDAVVPGIIQQVFPDHHGLVWYWYEFSAPEIGSTERLLVTFEAVDYTATVWVNGTGLGAHEGGDVPFTFDTTDAAVSGPGNLLAVRVLNPTAQRIDGMILDEVPHSNKADAGFWPGKGYNSGGIMGEVTLRLVPEIRVDDVFAVSTLGTGEISTRVRIVNSGGRSTPITLSLIVREDRSGIVVARSQAQVVSSPGSVDVSVTTQLEDVHPWDLGDPFLYSLSARLSGDQGEIDETVVKTGFRDFRVEEGFFRLNGKRLYLRSTHTGNHYPLGQKVAPLAAFVRQDLVYAKASGFNTVRFIAGLASEDQLAFCDEIGLLVYEEAAAAWLLGDSPHMGERFDRSVDQMIRRDRNHPSVVIWGLLNETDDGAVFRHAVGSLAAIRRLDQSRLVMLGSGRWDGDLSIGSVANPGQDRWQHEWGLESSSAPGAGVEDAGHVHPQALTAGAGDLHFYPRLPESGEDKEIIRSMGAGTKPVFLSEYGVGSLFDAITEVADAAPRVSEVVPPDLQYTRAMAKRFVEDWAQFEMESVYCFPEDAARASQEHQSRRRAVSFDLIRANPQIAGYNLTGMLDHALTGEGSWTFWRRWKPGAVEALADGWSPLRWCLSVEPTVVYPGDGIEIDLWLANEDVLLPGSYPVTLAMVAPDGQRRQEEVVVDTASPDAGDLARPVLRKRLTSGTVPGVYQCAASMGQTASPAAGRARFHVLERVAPLRLEAKVFGTGLEGPALAWLDIIGIDGNGDVAQAGSGDVVLVGRPASVPDLVWGHLQQVARAGATLVVLCPGELEVELSVDLNVRCVEFKDWLYHKECFARHHELFTGLPYPGLMDWEFYGDIIPRHLLQGAKPADVAAVAFAIGYPCPGGYVSGVLAGTYPTGAGHVVVSCFELLPHLGSSPVADRLAANLLTYASRLASGAVAT